MAIRDIITNKQKIVQVLSGNEVEELLSDNNHRNLLHFLFKGPLTVEELEIAFHDSGNEKSDKTIYRYLNKLKKAGLVIEAGKRIFSDQNNQIKTQTLFSRVAKIIFTPISRFDGDKNLEKRALEVTNILLKERLGHNKLAESKCLLTNINQVMEMKKKIVSDIFENIKNPKVLDMVEEFDIHELYPILDYLGWILVSIEQPQVLKDINKCYTK
ncbi:MAG: ArsR family transcriptional regulator [Candidatus Heimdallarchaeota archaeon]